jgi:hypothetical protein
VLLSTLRAEILPLSDKPPAQPSGVLAVLLAFVHTSFISEWTQGREPDGTKNLSESSDSTDFASFINPRLFFDPVNN